MPSSEDKVGVARRQVSLIKGDDRFVLAYSPGEEAAVLNRLKAMAEDSKSNFDWFDAAVLSYQLGRVMEQQLERESVLSRIVDDE